MTTRKSKFDPQRVPAEIKARVSEIKRLVRELRLALDALHVDSGAMVGIELELHKLSRELGGWND